VTGVEKTYDLTPLDDDYPEDENAVPALKLIESRGQTRNVMSKEIDLGIIQCQECEDVDCVQEDGDKFCPECGLMVGSDESDLKRDPKAANRYNE
jgi:hypothetical protein